MLLLFAILVQLGDGLVLGLQGTDPLARVLALKRQIRIGNAETLGAPGQALRGNRHAGLLGLFRQQTQKIDVVSEHDDLALRRLSGQALRHAFASAMVKRRHRVVEHDAALAAAQPDFG